MTEPERTLRLVLADDHAAVRAGLRTLLESQDGFEVVAETGDVDGARRYLLGHRPDILVLDLDMPGEDSLAAIPSFGETSPDTKIVVLTMQRDPASAREALRRGVLGYVLKEGAHDELVTAVRMAAEGRTYLTPELGGRLAAEPEDDGRPPGDLTEREVEVLRLIALGHTDSEVAQQLYLSVRAVESHRAHLRQKLGRATRAELVRYAVDHELVD